MSNPIKSDLINEPCFRSMMTLRASLTLMLHQKKSIIDSDDLTDLTEMLFLETVKTEPNGKQIKELLFRLLEMNPKLEAARRFLILNFARDKSWLQASKVLAELKKNQASDMGVENLEALVETRGFEPKLTLDLAAGLLSKDPVDARATFLMAFSLWKSNDHEEAYDSLRKAIELAPKNKNYTRLLQQLTQAGASDEMFLSALGLEIVAADFDR